MHRAEVRQLAARCRDELAAGEVELPLKRLQPLIAARTPFPILDLAGQIIAEAAQVDRAAFIGLLDGLAATDEIGAWPFIGSALAAAGLQFGTARAFAEARRYILQASVWHATDAIGERVLGEGLRADFDVAVSLLRHWRDEACPWLRRSVGVAVHRYAKRERDRPQAAARLLGLLAPMLEERDTAAIKGVGWGLKTIGRTYPDLLVPWLRDQIAVKKPRKLMVRKAVTYLPDDVRREFL
jgi:hypothetical protein